MGLFNVVLSVVLVVAVIVTVVLVFAVAAAALFLQEPVLYTVVIILTVPRVLEFIVSRYRNRAANTDTTAAGKAKAGNQPLPPSRAPAPSTSIDEDTPSTCLDIAPPDSPLLAARDVQAKIKRVQPPLKDEKPLAINDLHKILTLLKKHQYSGKSYYHLGLSLGLLDRTLEVITVNNNNNIEHCLREVLTRWLKKVDNVEKTTWSTLIAALEEINENEVAEEIERETDPVSMIIENHRHALSQSIQKNLMYIARLLSFELEELNKSLGILGGSDSEKTEVLLKIVKNAAYVDYKSILKFADILCKLHVAIGKTIEKDYRETVADVEVINMGRKEEFPIKVSLKCTQECKEIRNAWAIAIRSVVKTINVEEQELREFLLLHTSKNNSDVREKLSACHSKGEIMQVIIDQCSLIDVTLLDGIIKCFNMEEARKHINDYKKILNDFCVESTIRSWLDETVGCPSVLQCETLEFSVDKSIDEGTLKDIQDLITIAFESLSQTVRIVVIKEGNSFSITCSFPLALSELLIATALKNLEQLKKKGLIKLTIGYCTVYSQNKVKNATVDKFKKLVSKLLSVPTWSTHSEREKSQEITSVYNSSGTMKQLLVSLTVQLVNNEASFNKELAEKTALVKEVENEGDIRTQKLKLMIEESQEKIQVLQDSLNDAKAKENIASMAKEELNKEIKTQLRISRKKDEEIANFKATAIKEKNKMAKSKKDLESQIEALKNEIKKENEKNIEAESRMKDLITTISEKDEAITELQHLFTVESSSKDGSDTYTFSQSESRKHKQIEPTSKESIRITSPSLATCRDVITKIKDNKNHKYLLIKLSPEAARLLIPALLNTSTVEQLMIHYTSLRRDFILSLSSQVSTNESISMLEFQYDTIDDDGAIALLHSLKNNTGVTELSVSYNTSITSLSVEPLKELLLTNKTLEKLDIMGTNIDTDGVLSLTEALEINKQIRISLNGQHEKACSSLPYYDKIKESLLFL